MFYFIKLSVYQHKRGLASEFSVYGNKMPPCWLTRLMRDWCIHTYFMQVDLFIRNTYIPAANFASNPLFPNFSRLKQATKAQFCPGWNVCLACLFSPTFTLVVHNIYLLLTYGSSLLQYNSISLWKAAGYCRDPLACCGNAHWLLYCTYILCTY